VHLPPALTHPRRSSSSRGLDLLAGVGLASVIERRPCLLDVLDLIIRLPRLFRESRRALGEGSRLLVPAVTGLGVVALSIQRIRMWSWRLIKATAHKERRTTFRPLHVDQPGDDGEPCERD